MRYPICALSAQLTHVIIIIIVTAVIEGNREVKSESSQFVNIRMFRNALGDFLMTRKNMIVNLWNRFYESIIDRCFLSIQIFHLQIV
jgi:hypothetical protein